MPVHHLVGPTTSAWQLKTTPAKTTVKIAVSDAQGAAVDRFDKIHTKPLHLIAIDVDSLDVVAHAHPTLKNGKFSGSLPSLQGAYALFAEYDPQGALPQTMDRYSVGTPGQSAPGWDFQTKKKTVNGVTVELLAANLMPGMAMPVRVRLTDANGKPYTPKTWLAAKGHMLAAQEKAPELYHFHPASGASSGGHNGHGSTQPAKKGEIEFAAEVANSGPHRLFLQFVKKGETTPTTVSFDVNV